MRRILLVGAVALLLGIGLGEYLAKDFSFRRWVGHYAGRGELQALAGHRGIYDRDVERAWQAQLFARGAAPPSLASATAVAEQRAVLDRLIILEKLDDAAASEPIDSAALKREIDLLRWQTPDEKTWRQALRRAALNPRQLRREVARHLRQRLWIEDQIAPQIRTDEEESRHYFATHRATFLEPRRWRASHLFLAAPEGYPVDVIEAKRAMINTLANRLANGEAFGALVAESSEDEATKKRGGDLGYFAAKRMLPAVSEAVQRLQPGEISPSIRSRLGFHLIRLTETRPARPLTFEEAQPEIATDLENEKRAAATARLLAALR